MAQLRVNTSKGFTTKSGLVRTTTARNA